jgi:hypothetical protein
MQFRVSWGEKVYRQPRLKWVIKGGIKNAIDNSVIRNDSISGKGRTGIEVQEILCGNDNDWSEEGLSLHIERLPREF